MFGGSFTPYLPENLESYVQQAGRAGRDGNRSQCILFLNDTKIRESQERVERRAPNLERMRSLYQHIANQGQVAIGEQPHDAMKFSLATWALKEGVRMSEAKESIALSGAVRLLRVCSKSRWIVL